MNEKDKKNLALIFLIICGLLIGTFTALMFLSIIRHSQPDENLHLKDTKCEVVRSEMGGNAKCNCSRDKETTPDGNCTSEYPCLSVMVNYTVMMENSTEVMMTSFLRDKENSSEQSSQKQEDVADARETGNSWNGTNENKWQCSITPMCTEEFKRNNESVYNYRRKYGIVGLAFRCYYDPRHISTVQVWNFHSSSIWSNKFLTYIFAALLVFSSFAGSTVFKWYKLLLLRSHADEINGTNIPPADTRFSIPDFPPPYSERPLPQNDNHLGFTNRNEQADE